MHAQRRRVRADPPIGPRHRRFGSSIRQQFSTPLNIAMSRRHGVSVGGHTARKDEDEPHVALSNAVSYLASADRGRSTGSRQAKSAGIAGRSHVKQATAQFHRSQRNLATSTASATGLVATWLQPVLRAAEAR